MFLYKKFVPGLAIYSYMIGDEKTKKCAVIDPTRDVEEYIQVAAAHGLNITDILETHVQADYILGSKELKHRLQNKPIIHASGMGGKEWTPSYVDQSVKNGDEVNLGNIRLKALHTPGHTFEHLCWLLFDDIYNRDTPCCIFTGDLLFTGDIGRPDLLGDEHSEPLARKLYHSLFNVIADLPEFIEIYPGHGAGSRCGASIGSRESSTLGYERLFNQSLKKQEESVWVKLLLSRQPPIPRYFSKVKSMNVIGPEILYGKPLPKSIGAKELNDQIKQLCIVDIRSKEAFSAAHIPMSINIPLTEAFAMWAGTVLPYDMPLVLVFDQQSDLNIAITQLSRIGIDRVQGYLEGGITSWETLGLPLSNINTISVNDLAQAPSTHTPYILDIRTKAEWNAGHIKNAIHQPLGDPDIIAKDIPSGQAVTVICGSGLRASIACSLLKKAGVTNVCNVLGGMMAWKNAGHPMISA